MRKIFEAMPLTIFIIYISLIDTAVLVKWKAPFLLSALAGLIVIISLFYKKMVFNRIILGINLYFISGGLAFVTGQAWLYGIYYQLQASGMMLWIIAVGIISLFFSPRGFIGVDSSDTRSIRKYSGFLLVFCIIAFAFSFRLRADRILSGLIPFTCLFLLQKLFKRNFSKKEL